MAVEKKLRDQSARFQNIYAEQVQQTDKMRNVVRIFGMQTVVYEAALHRILVFAQEGDFDQVEKIAKEALENGTELMDEMKPITTTTEESTS